jgi:hypothetical protein
VKKNWSVDESSGCWLWKGYVGKRGYAVYTKLIDGKRPIAHRYVYEALIGPIPEGMTLDHLCGHPSCVNPEHLEPVTLRENVLRGTKNPTALNARKTHCKYGHEFTDENTWIYRGYRHCRECRRREDRKRPWAVRQARRKERQS